ncbi:MAG: hypothetical protein K2P78_04530 [Gemmataceae bacterium]|nr:hypothetical protein [Gemmataceae bacterium]
MPERIITPYAVSNSDGVPEVVYGLLPENVKKLADGMSYTIEIRFPKILPPLNITVMYFGSEIEREIFFAGLFKSKEHYEGGAA